VSCLLRALTCSCTSNASARRRRRAGRCFRWVFAEFERSMIRGRVMAGLSRAKADGLQLGRRLEDTAADKVAAIIAARATGTGVRRIARDLGVGVGTALRVTGKGAEVALKSPFRCQLIRHAVVGNHGPRMSYNLLFFAEFCHIGWN
jgi:DNA invertase Pin-like site-specific DNA recombinase